MTDCSRGPTARRVWHVDPLNKSQDPVLRELGLIVSNYAYQKPATLHFEPWLKHMCSVYLQEGDETHAVASSGGRYYPVTDDLREDVETREVWSDTCLLQSAFQPLIREICGIGLEADGVAREGSGALSVRGHKSSLIANISPSIGTEGTCSKLRRAIQPAVLWGFPGMARHQRSPVGIAPAVVIDDG